MADKPSLYDRIVWHPVIPLAMLAWMLYRLSQGFTAARSIGIIVGIIWLIFAVRAFLHDRRKPIEPVKPDSETDRIAQEWYDEKSARMEKLLGKEHDHVMHAVIPFAIGGGLDLYYYPHGIPGVAIATKELCELPGDGPSNKVLKTYELVMFTRQPLDMDSAQDDQTLFGQAHANINRILNCIARYCTQAMLNPNETCEFPADMPKVGGKCMIFDVYHPTDKTPKQDFGLLLIIEIHRSEMDFARTHGGRELLMRLKEAQIYPYSDLDRPPVI